MSSPLDLIFGQITKAISNHASPNTPGPSYDANPLLGALQGIFNNHAGQTGHPFTPNPQYGYGEDFHQQYGNVAPASQDPWGDPADSQGGFQGQVRPASEDPWGDPADSQGGFQGQVRPASEDPWGDPADQGR